MKKATNNLIFILSMMLLSSCLQEPDVKVWELDVVLDLDEHDAALFSEGISVRLYNLQKNDYQDAVSDKDGMLKFSDVESGFYRLTVAESIFNNGIQYHYNGNKDLEVFSSQKDTLKLTQSTKSIFVIREIYFNGSLTSAGKNYTSDQYIEIVNNTDQMQYADGLSILEHAAYENDENIWKTILDTIVVKAIWTIPGTGNDVPVEPGKGLVIARDGINHRDDEMANPNSPVNLGDADFEFFVFSENLVDLDVPDVANMEEDLFVYRGSDFVMFIRGGSAMALAYLPGATQAERLAYINSHLVAKTNPTGSSKTYFAKIPNTWVIDAVEVVRDQAHAVYKRFPLELDAGYVFNSSGTASGKCIRRKVERVDEGRTIYQDTDNSTQDFLTDVDPNPGVYEE